MTKSYEDGIMDALNVVSKWDHIGLIYSVINTIKDQLIKLLPPDFDLSQNKDYDSSENITEILDELDYMNRLSQ